MPFCPFFCPYMNQQDDENEDQDQDFRSPDGFGPPFGKGKGKGPNKGPNFGLPFNFPYSNPSDFHGDHDGPPSGPPPSKAPVMKSQFGGPSLKAVDSGAIKHCIYQFVYIWPEHGRPFWAYLNYVGKKSVAGYRWNGYSWRFFGMDLDNIESFECY